MDTQRDTVEWQLKDMMTLLFQSEESFLDDNYDHGTMILDDFEKFILDDFLKANPLDSLTPKERKMLLAIKEMSEDRMGLERMTKRFAIAFSQRTYVVSYDVIEKHESDFGVTHVVNLKLSDGTEKEMSMGYISYTRFSQAQWKDHLPFPWTEEDIDAYQPR